MPEQVLPQLILIFQQLRARQEDVRQNQAQTFLFSLLGCGLSAEERADPERSVRHQPAADRRRAYAGRGQPRPVREGRAPAILHHMPHDPAAGLDDVVHPGTQQAKECADREGRARNHRLDQR